jgi:N-acetylglutamate synthase-like GNAT family acetyltransferase
MKIIEVLEKVAVQTIIADKSSIKYIPKIVSLINEASKIEGSGLALRSEEYLNKKFTEGKAVLAFVNSELVGFCYIETWENRKYIANSGLVVNNEFRGMGIAKKIKKAAFNLSRKKYTNSKIFGLTTSLAVMKINSSLGYVPVTFSELTTDVLFWKGCETCKYYDILVRTKRESCLCTAMVVDPTKNL